MMKPFENEIDRCLKLAEKAQRMAEILGALPAPPPGVGVSFNSIDVTVTLIITNLKKLVDAREYAQSVLPEWDGKIGTIWSVCGRRHASWEDRVVGGFEIRLSCVPEEWPKNLLGGGTCEWVPSTQTTEVFVCKGAEA